MLRYIEANPLRARMVADPAEYRWSSYQRKAQKGGTYLTRIVRHAGRPVRLSPGRRRPQPDGPHPADGREPVGRIGRIGLRVGSGSGGDDAIARSAAGSAGSEVAVSRGAITADSGSNSDGPGSGGDGAAGGAGAGVAYAGANSRPPGSAGAAGGSGSSGRATRSDSAAGRSS